MSITKSDESEQAVSVHSSPPESKNEANRAECLAAIPGKEFEEKNTNGQKPSIKAEKQPGNPKSIDPFTWENYRTSDRRAIRLWGLLNDLVEGPMKIPMSEYLQMDISDVVRKDLEQLPQTVIKWLSNEQ